MKHLIYLTVICGLAWLSLQTITSARQEIHAANPCHSVSSGMFSLGFFKLNKDSVKDTGCEQIEAARLAVELGMQEEAKFILCNHPGAKSAFSDATNCMQYNGNYQKMVTEVNDRHDYCDRRKRKWYRKITFTSKRIYKKCMRGEA